MTNQLRYIFLIISFFTTVYMRAADPVQIMNSAASIVNGKNVKASFSISGAMKLSGTIRSANGKFAVESNKNSVWYDGKTMATYNRSTNEVTLIHPSAAEISEANPLGYVSGWSKSYKASMASRQPSSGYCILLTPRSAKSGVGNVVITLSAKLIPQKIVIKTKQKQTYSINITNFSTGGSVTASAFTFPKSKYKGAKTVDLR